MRNPLTADAFRGESGRGGLYLIECKRDRPRDVALWWKPKSCGYTTLVDKAGRYTFVEALSIAPPQRWDGDRVWRECDAELASSRVVVL